MADTVVRLHYAGEMRPVAAKQNAWEDSVAHPRHARAERGTEGVTEELVVDQGRYGSSAGVDGGVPVTAVDEMIKQQGTKHHGNMEKMEQHFARTEANRRTPATRLIPQITPKFI